MDEQFFPVITICGSMRYFEEMLNHARNLTRLGFIVLMPFDGIYQGGKPADMTKLMLDEMHKSKIRMSEAIHVIGSHIGESTASEIDYAKAHNKKVIMVTEEKLQYSANRG